MNYTERFGKLLKQVREESPLVHHITNLVVMNDTANVTLHLGARPVMALSRLEAPQMVVHARALVLNLGTLDEAVLAAAERAGEEANQRGVPVVLDPVGVGATPYRTKGILGVLGRVKPTVIRGNAGEIGVLAGAGGMVSGVDSSSRAEEMVEAAHLLARARGCVVAMTGKQDLVTDGERTLWVANGHPLLTTLTGTGCMATTAVAVFLSTGEDPLIATAAALAAYGLAAEQAAKEARGPGSFRIALQDALYHLGPEALARGARVNEASTA